MPENESDLPDSGQLRDLVAQVLDVEPSLVTDAARFADLGCDSLIALELVVNLEKRYAVKIEDAEFDGVDSLPAVRALIAAKLAEAS